ncbi:MAG: polyketide synthase, partial [Anaerolineales bacterium]|nr:polyketide synthase [Anaerolineales bacterium]
MILEKSEFFERVSKLSPKRLAILATELQSKLEVNERRQKEPIAVIGIGCRFPGGVSTPEAYWELLCNGVDAIMEVPASRWDIDAYYHPNPPLPGKMTTRWGGFIDGVDQFDPQFFGISPREAISMDPQQRLLLEIVWEALEHAGQSPDKLSESHTGVFIGLTSGDYYHMQLDAGRANFDPHLASGSSQSIAAGRIAYVLGLQGPCMTLDTACSSSLVAVHLAVQSLRNGESHIALAGGANVILMPEATITLSRANMMAADGRCKAFDARADGFVRSEGCGIIVLKRLSDAISHGDNILAIIKGMAINQDGRSNGLTAPNGPS